MSKYIMQSKEIISNDDIRNEYKDSKWNTAIESTELYIGLIENMVDIDLIGELVCAVEHVKKYNHRKFKVLGRIFGLDKTVDFSFMKGYISDSETVKIKTKEKHTQQLHKAIMKLCVEFGFNKYYFNGKLIENKTDVKTRIYSKASKTMVSNGHFKYGVKMVENVKTTTLEAKSTKRYEIQDEIKFDQLEKQNPLDRTMEIDFNKSSNVQSNQSFGGRI